MNEMADSIVKRVFGKKGKELTREQMLQAIDDNMLLAGLAISERLAKLRDEEDFSLPDAMQMFKQVREYQMSEARRSKLDPTKDKNKDGTPDGISGYQNQLATDKANYVEPPASERVTSEGKRDKRHDNEGRPPGLSLAKQQEKIRQQQARMAAKEAKASEPISETKEETNAPDAT